MFARARRVLIWVLPIVALLAFAGALTVRERFCTGPGWIGPGPEPENLYTCVEAFSWSFGLSMLAIAGTAATAWMVLLIRLRPAQSSQI